MRTDDSMWDEKLTQLKEMHTHISRLIGGKSVAYLDIPIHFNIGDLLIYKGTEQFFKNNNINVVYRSCIHACKLKEVKKADVILLHGGGNFGDIYTKHQKFREMIVTKFKEKRIICLPQTIKFSSEKRLDVSSEIFKSHKDFHLLVRDKKSFEVSRTFTSNTQLIPDMAHSLHPIIEKSEVGIGSGVINLSRMDVESDGKEYHNRPNKPVFDWKTITTLNDYSWKVSYLALSRIGMISNRASGLAMWIWEKASDDAVFRSMEYFIGKECVYTDRLHGMIFSILLGKTVFMYDNSYGKNSAYYDMWLKDIALINKK